MFETTLVNVKTVRLSMKSKRCTPMLRNGRRYGLTLILLLVTLLGPAIASVDAAYVTATTETHSQDFERAVNGHAYVFSDEPPLSSADTTFLTHDEDIVYEQLDYENGHWNTYGPYAADGPEEHKFNFGSRYEMDSGWLHEGAYLPDFLDFENTTNDVEIGMKAKRAVFPVTLNEEFSVLLESGLINWGTFNLTDEEFLHIQIAGGQDNLEAEFAVIDPEGRPVAFEFIEGGDIVKMPCLPSGEGMYTFLVYPYNTDYGLISVDILMEAITPQEVGFGETIEDILEGSETLVKEDGSEVYQEKPPVARTYKFTANSTHPGRIRYALNYPEDVDGGPSPEAQISIFGNVFQNDIGHPRWMDYLDPYSDEFHYYSWANESYYLTIEGLDEIEYIIHHDRPNVPMLPTNEEFYIENMLSGGVRYPYRLPLAQDSVLRVNGSTGMAGFSWKIWKVTEDRISYSRSISFGSEIEYANTYYLPAGNYLVTASGGEGAIGRFEFNLGPILDGAGSVGVDAGDIIGLRVDTSPLSFYRSNVTLMTHDNVSVKSEIDYLNGYGGYEESLDITLGNRQSGTSWVAYGTNTTSTQLGTDDTSYSMFCEGEGIIVLTPYQVNNNTAGIGNEYHEYTVDYEITFDEYEGFLNGTKTQTVTSDPVWSNFTLGDPAEPTETYVLRLSAVRGTWMNFSIYTEDVDSWEAYLYQNVDGCSHYIDWTNDLEDVFTGSLSGDGYLELGSISDEMMFVFKIDRSEVEEGSFNILVTPHTTNTLETLPPLEYEGGDAGAPEGGDWLAQNALLLAGGVGVAAVVIVGGVYFWRKRAA
ncbi:MAG: hypothetical protein R6V83_08315 [Candidatus Thorarchaeota archaeon]